MLRIMGTQRLQYTVISYTHTRSVQTIQHVQLLQGLRSKVVERLAVVVDLHGS